MVLSASPICSDAGTVCTLIVARRANHKRLGSCISCHPRTSLHHREHILGGSTQIEVDGLRRGSLAYLLTPVVKRRATIEV